jgi:uncharacterized membrane protein
MLINLVLSLFAIYLIIGLVAIVFGVVFLGSIAYNIHQQDNRAKKKS